MRFSLKALILGATCALTAPAPLIAQGLFSPAIGVNDDVITGYELDQREKLLEVFRSPGDLSDLAREQLIDDRLRMAEMARAGVALDADALQTALNDFAGRANLSLPEFLQILSQNGVAEESLRDFVRVGVSWRDYVRGRFAGQALVSEAEVDAALGQSRTTESSIEVLLSEIIIPAPPPQAASALATARRIAELTSTSAFSAEARRVSALASRENGGRLGWLPISNYPPQLRTLILSLSPGEVTAPIQIPNGVALFQLRDIREVATKTAPPAAIDYAAFYIPGGQSAEARAEAASVAARVDVCDDLYGVAHGLPEDRLDRQSIAPSEIASDIALELAKLDPGEISTALTRNDGQTLVFLMLCQRERDSVEDVDRDTVEGQLISRRLTGFADALLADLRASATIVDY